MAGTDGTAGQNLPLQILPSDRQAIQSLQLQEPYHDIVTATSRVRSQSHLPRTGGRSQRLGTPEAAGSTPPLQEGEDQSNQENRTRIRQQTLNLRRARSVIIAEGLEEAKTLAEHNGYHQAISGREAEHRLKKCGGHCYLTRYSKIQNCYVLSVYEQRRHTRPVIGHFKIIIEDNGDHRIGGKTKTFPTIQSLLEYYQDNRIDPDLKKIGRPYTEEEYEHSIRCTIL